MMPDLPNMGLERDVAGFIVSWIPELVARCPVPLSWYPGPDMWYCVLGRCGWQSGVDGSEVGLGVGGCVCSVRFCLVLFCSVWFGSVLFGSVLLCSVLFDSGVEC